MDETTLRTMSIAFYDVFVSGRVSKIGTAKVKAARGR
jgi:hypothetical protein